MPSRKPGPTTSPSIPKPGRTFTETDCTRLYSVETHLDDREIPGHYPPDDTGSAGIYSAKALVSRGLIDEHLVLAGSCFAAAAPVVPQVLR